MGLGERPRWSHGSPAGPLFCPRARDAAQPKQGCVCLGCRLPQRPPHKRSLCPRAAPPGPRDPAPLPESPPCAATLVPRGSAHPPRRLLVRCPNCPQPSLTAHYPAAPAWPNPAPPPPTPTCAPPCALLRSPEGLRALDFSASQIRGCALRPSCPQPPDQVSRGGRPSPPATPGLGEGPESRVPWQQGLASCWGARRREVWHEGWIGSTSQR